MGVSSVLFTFPGAICYTSSNICVKPQRLHELRWGHERWKIHSSEIMLHLMKKDLWFCLAVGSLQAKVVAWSGSNTTHTPVSLNGRKPLYGSDVANDEVKCHGLRKTQQDCWDRITVWFHPCGGRFMSVSCFCFAAGKRHSFSACSAAQDAGLILWINMTPIMSELLPDGSWHFMMESLQELEVGTGF